MTYRYRILVPLESKSKPQTHRRLAARSSDRNPTHPVNTNPSYITLYNSSCITLAKHNFSEAGCSLCCFHLCSIGLRKSALRQIAAHSRHVNLSAVWQYEICHLLPPATSCHVLLTRKNVSRTSPHLAVATCRSTRRCFASPPGLATSPRSPSKWRGVVAESTPRNSGV